MRALLEGLTAIAVMGLMAALLYVAECGYAGACREACRRCAAPCSDGGAP